MARALPDANGPAAYENDDSITEGTVSQGFDLVSQRGAGIELIEGGLPDFINKVQQEGKQKEVGFWRSDDSPECFLDFSLLCRVLHDLICFLVSQMAAEVSGG